MRSDFAAVAKLRNEILKKAAKGLKFAACSLKRFACSLKIAKRNFKDHPRQLRNRELKFQNFKCRDALNFKSIGGESRSRLQIGGAEL